MLAEQPDRTRKLREVELAIAVSQKHVLERGPFQAGTDGSAISSIAEMGDDRELRDGFPEADEDRCGVIRAAVVHYDDLELRSQTSADFGGLTDHPGNVALLVEARNHHRKPHPAQPNANPETLASQIVRGYVRP